MDKIGVWRRFKIVKIVGEIIYFHHHHHHHHHHRRRRRYHRRRRYDDDDGDDDDYNYYYITKREWSTHVTWWRTRSLSSQAKPESCHIFFTVSV
jgi:hypothetical protein